MALIEIKSMKLHGSLNACGINLQDKVDATKKLVKLTYDDVKKRVLVVANGRLEMIPESSVFSMEPFNQEAFGVELIVEQPKTREASLITKSIKAQVESPHNKVQNPPTRRTVPGQ